MSANPIAELLGLTARPGKQAFALGHRSYELFACSPEQRSCETLYRTNPGHGVPNPGFTLHLTPPSHHAMTLGNHLAGRAGVKRLEAEAIVLAARMELSRQRAEAERRAEACAQLKRIINLLELHRGTDALLAALDLHEALRADTIEMLPRPRDAGEAT